MAEPEDAIPEQAEPEDENQTDDLRAATRLVYESALRRIRDRVSGHELITQRLAIAATQHMIAPEGGIRLTIIGPSGSGKTTMARALAHVTSRPFVEFSMTDMVQTGWQGPQLSDLVSASLLSQAVTLSKARKGTVPTLLSEAVIFIDEADKAAFGGTDGPTRSHYVGKQQTLLGMLSTNGRLLIEGEAVSTGRMMIVCAGVFDGLTPGTDPMPEDIEALGFLHELVERMGVFHRMGPLEGTALRDVLRKGLEANLTVTQLFGYDLEVSEQALCYAANAVAQGRAGPRSAVSWLRAAADQCLERLLSAEAPAGTKATLSPDDLRIAAHKATA